jgi:hypothetical protein
MSYSLALENGDLHATGSRLDIVQGSAKLAQDIDLWLREAYQIDRFHPNFGSILDSYIGGVVSVSTQTEVQSEVLRVLQNYQNIQLSRFQANPQKFSPDELLNDVTGVTTQVAYDKVVITVNFTTAAGTAATSSLTVTP